MSGDVTMQVEGLRDIERTLTGFLKETPGILQAGLREPMQRVLDDAKRLVPKDTWALHDSLQLVGKRATAMRASSAVDALAYEGIRIRRMTVLQRAKYTKKGTRNVLPNPRSYWHLVEFGTAHSGAQSFLRPAFDENTERMVGSFKSIVSERIERTIARYARRRARGRR